MAGAIKLSDVILGHFRDGTIDKLDEECTGDANACGGTAITQDQEDVIAYVLHDGKVTEREKAMLGFLPSDAVGGIAGSDGLKPARMKAEALVKKLDEKVAATDPFCIPEIIDELALLGPAVRATVLPKVRMALKRVEHDPRWLEVCCQDGSIYGYTFDALSSYISGTLTPGDDGKRTLELIDIFLKDHSVEGMLVERFTQGPKIDVDEKVVSAMARMSSENLKAIVDARVSDDMSLAALRSMTRPERKANGSFREAVLIAAAGNDDMPKARDFAVAKIVTGPFKSEGAEEIRRGIITSDIETPEGVTREQAIVHCSSATLKDLIENDARLRGNTNFLVRVLRRKTDDPVGPMAVAALVELNSSSPYELKRALKPAFHREASDATIDAAVSALREVGLPEDSDAEYGITTVRSLVEWSGRPYIPSADSPSFTARVDYDEDDSGSPHDFRITPAFGFTHADILERNGDTVARNEGNGINASLELSWLPLSMIDDHLQFGLRAHGMISGIGTDYAPVTDADDAGQVGIHGGKLGPVGSITLMDGVLLEASPFIGYYNVNHQYSRDDENGDSTSYYEESFSVGRYGWGGDVSLKAFIPTKSYQLDAGVSLTYGHMELGGRGDETGSGTADYGMLGFVVTTP